MVSGEGGRSEGIRAKKRRYGVGERHKGKNRRSRSRRMMILLASRCTTPRPEPGQVDRHIGKVASVVLGANAAKHDKGRVVFVVAEVDAEFGLADQALRVRI